MCARTLRSCRSWTVGFSANIYGGKFGKAWVGGDCLRHLGTPAARTAVAAEPQSRITILYDAFGKDASMKWDWGFSALVLEGQRPSIAVIDEPPPRSIGQA